MPALSKLEQAVAAERNRLLTQVKVKLHEQIGNHRGVWRARLLREVTLRWGGGAFASFLRLFNSARSLLPFLPALRARGLGPMLVTGSIGAGQAIARQIRERWSDGSWFDAAELGLNAGDLAQSQSVLEGFAREARVAEENKTVGNSSAEATDLLVAAAKQFETQVDAEIGSAIERRVAGKAGVFIHGVLELLFIALPALLLWRLAKNFFYEHLWVEPSRPLLGFDFLLQSALWIVVWGLAAARPAGVATAARAEARSIGARGSLKPSHRIGSALRRIHLADSGDSTASRQTCHAARRHQPFANRTGIGRHRGNSGVCEPSHS